jgi:hypothetical protein
MLGRGDLVREVGCEGGGPVIGKGKGRTDTGGGTRGKKGRKGIGTKGMKKGRQEWSGIRRAGRGKMDEEKR